MIKTFFVIDTNCFISANLIKNSASALAFDKAIVSGIIALSENVLNEYTEVLYRKKLDKYLDNDERQNILRQLNRNAIFFTPVETITVCRDPKDNIFLELALACQASCIISGDPDLLVLDPFQSISILKPTAFLNVTFDK